MKRHWLVGAAAIALWHSAGTAQDAPGQEAVTESGPIADIVVTAQRRAERNQDVPIAISAFDAAALERQKLDSPIDLQIQTPNLLVVGNDRPTIRGVGNNAISPTADNGTGVLLNFAPIGFRAQDEFYDVERIEVLRGPQGTLYGRNTTGGTINLITAKPNDRLGGYVTAEYGSYDTKRVHGAINLPIDPAVQLRVAGFYLNRDGYTRNLTTGNRIDGRDQYSWRTSLRIIPGPDTKIDIMFQRSKEDSTRTRETKRLCKATPVLGCSPLQLGFDSPDVTGVLFQTLLGPFTNTLVPPGFNIYAGAPNPTDLRAVAADTDASFVSDQNSLTAEITHRVGGVDLIALTGYTRGSQIGNLDYDNAALPFRFLAPITYTAAAGPTVTTNQLITTDSFIGRSKAFYQELRAVSAFDGPINFTLGANYFRSQGSSNFIIYHPAIELFAKLIRGLPQEAWIFNSDTPFARTKSYAAFGELYFNLGDATKLTVGLRYTKDDKAIRTRTIFLATPPAYAVASGSYDAVSGRAVIDHKLSSTNLVYASFARGFKGGGLNVGATGAPAFDPEYINAFEIGSKNEFLGRTLQANLSAFYYDYTNLQLGQRLGTSITTVNSDAKVYGLEGEFVWVPVERLRLNATAGYLHTRIGSLLTIDPANPAQYNGTGAPTRTPAVPVNLDGKRLPYSPSFKFSVGAEYSVPLGDSGWSLTARGDYSRQSSYFAREFNTSNDRIAAWGIGNAFLRLSDGERLTIEGYVKNIGDKDNITNSIIESDLVGSYRNVRILDPRTYGVSTTFRF